MPKGSVSFAAHRPNSRFYLGVRNPLLPRCVLQLPSNHDERVRPARGVLHHPQCCMLKSFGDLIGWTVEAYVDDIVVKSKRADHLIVDLEQTFAKLQANGIKLNPEKCVLGS